MKIRAVLFDLYQTVLQVGPRPPTANALWEDLCFRELGFPSSVTLDSFDRAAQVCIRTEHESARAAGVDFPEVFWPDIAVAAFPALAELPAERLDAFLYRHAQIQRSIQLMPGSAEALRFLNEQQMLMGIISNSQPYTLHELDHALADARLTRSIFDPDHCIFSFRTGFSKPNPHLFRMAVARLRSRGIQPPEVLMVGDRLDNDIEPAQVQGWQTWRLGQPPGDGLVPSGDWFALRHWLAQKRVAAV